MVTALSVFQAVRHQVLDQVILEGFRTSNGRFGRSVMLSMDSPEAVEYPRICSIDPPSHPVHPTT